MTLAGLQEAMCKALRESAYLRAHAIPVVAEDEGNVAAEWDARFARTHLAVTVGAASFAPTSRDSRVIAGMARLAATVWEQPSRNRVGQNRLGPNAAEVAEALACEMHLAPFGGGVLVFTGVGGVERADGKTITRTVGFETLATLTGEEQNGNH